MLFYFLISSLFTFSLQIKTKANYLKHSKQIPFISAFRGVPAYVPGDTITGMKIANQMGADFFEFSIAVTKDLRLICHEEIGLKSSTNIRSKKEF